MLVVAQIALAFVLVIGTALLSRSLFLLVNTNPGFDFHNVLNAFDDRVWQSSSGLGRGYELLPPGSRQS